MTTFKKTSALTATVLVSGALLAGCGSSEWDGTWTGDITATNAETGGGTATVTVKGGDCSWTMTETTGETNGAKCKQSGEDFKLADPLTGQDLKYTGQVTNDTLTLTPQNDAAEKVGVMVLQR
ncbi:hypothetical protein JKI95_06040 [Corynebacterium aquatimens]|uniref:hypothetical protein n=1 Tax=Corynebacterium aquatimens TaxID=1190508 RepID=UPI00253FC577|nr:hypothetical protein [Corynebacterium aquatimens]QYH18918.1 hypothetical protein JKI95_06040 [Corynebacterium aquatimens]